MKQHVFLIPGFFGFSSFGRLKYFNGVAETLQHEFARAGEHAKVVEIDTLPTGSIRRRAARLIEIVHRSVENDPGPIHLVGHSTGGLDARLVVCPNADLRLEPKLEVVERVKTVVTVATPHFGTPLANAFSGALGRPVLKLVALMLFYVLQHGRLPIGVGVHLVKLVTRLDDFVGLKDTFADEVFDKLLKELGDEERTQLLDFLDGVSNDQSLLFQLTEAGCDLFNATTGKPDRLRYASVVTCARGASLHTVWRNAADVYAQGLHGIYALLHGLTARTDPRWFPDLAAPVKQALMRDLGELPNHRDNDGVVPTHAQVWGNVLGAVRADHLDVIGHFGDLESAAGSDWFPSSSGFTREHFERTWRRVALFLLEREPAPAEMPPA